MNPLTLVKRIKEINSKEASLGISESASWHSKYKESPYVYVGGIPFDLTEGDVLAMFSQYGEIVDVNLVRDKGTGKSKGFAFVAYEDQRSTNLAVDNLNGANIVGRIIRVDHCLDYKKKEEQDEELEQQKREERGVCRAFQRGDCNRGASCKFSHNEQRAANTGWGPQDDIPKWGHDKHEAPPIKSGRVGGNFSSRRGDSHDQENNIQSDDKGKRLSRTEDDSDHRASYPKRREMNHDRRGAEKPSEISEKEPCLKGSDRQAERRDDRDRGRRDDRDRGRRDERSSRYESDQKPKENHDRKEGSGRYVSEANLREDRGGKGGEDRSGRHGSHRKPSEDHDRKENSGRHESEPKPRDGRNRTGREDRSGRHESERNNIDSYDQRDTIKRSRYDEDELQARRARR